MEARLANIKTRFKKKDGCIARKCTRQADESSLKQLTDGISKTKGTESLSYFSHQVLTQFLTFPATTKTRLHLIYTTPTATSQKKPLTAKCPQTQTTALSQTQGTTL